MEKVENIALSIKNHRELEIENKVVSAAIARSLVRFEDENIPCWIVMTELTALNASRDFNGNIIPNSSEVERYSISGNRKVVMRDTKLGALLLQHHKGEHEYNEKRKKRYGHGEIEITNKITIFNRTGYTPSTDKSDGLAKEIKIYVGDDNPKQYRNLAKILELEEGINLDKEKLKNATREEEAQLIERIKSKEKEMQGYLDKAQRFVRSRAKLRFQPILDPIQDSIRRLKIFDGTLIINGGPGTGKTTSLIQRIKFLISPTIEEYRTFNEVQKDLLFNQDASWIFYSPNELLSLFLQDNMLREGLYANKNKVKVWSSHKNELVKSYKLVDTINKRPFLIYNKHHQNSLIKNSSESVNSVIAGLLKFYFAFQLEKLHRIIEIDVSKFKWKNTGISIQKFLESKKGIYTIEELLNLIINLKDLYAVESEKITSDYSRLLNKVAARIQVLVNKDSNRIKVLSDLLKTWKEAALDSDEEEDLEIIDFDENDEQIDFDFESDFFSKLKVLCRKNAQKEFDKNTKFSKRELELLKLLPEVQSQPEYSQIGQIAFFKKHFEKMTKGVVSNVFLEIPSIYKRFRKEKLIQKDKFFELVILNELVNKDSNSRLHSDEQALLLYFINNICYKFASGFKNQYETLSHPYINAHKLNCKPVIAIDEASDFSLIDLLAIESFKHPELASLTLSGDIMQRMNENGLNSWEEFTSIISNSEVKDLVVSYRQSPTLLAMAKIIYEKSTGVKPTYHSYIEKDDLEPKPLLKVSNDEEEKLEWIANRIIEIYKAYGEKIPSIAIFLPEESTLEAFASKLGIIDTLADVGIFVKPCRNGEVLGDNDTVRVFSIDKIKGLEFEAVFFHNLDAIESKGLSNDMLLKYLYVGLSRATFYLGLTLNKALGKELNFLLNNFEESDLNWEINMNK